MNLLNLVNFSNKLKVLLGKYNILYYESAQEGPNSTLRVERIDDENIRFTLVSNKWFEHFWNDDKRTVQVNWCKFKEGGYNVKHTRRMFTTRCKLY